MIFRVEEVLFECRIDEFWVSKVEFDGIKSGPGRVRIA